MRSNKRFHAALYFKRNEVSNRTVSEIQFEKLCANRGVVCERIPESITKSADYRVSLGSTTLITEVKQLDSNDKDEKLGEVWALRNLPAQLRHRIGYKDCWTMVTPKLSDHLPVSGPL